MKPAILFGLSIAVSMGVHASPTIESHVLIKKDADSGIQPLIRANADDPDGDVIFVTPDDAQPRLLSRNVRRGNQSKWVLVRSVTKGVQGLSLREAPTTTIGRRADNRAAWEMVYTYLVAGTKSGGARIRNAEPSALYIPFREQKDGSKIQLTSAVEQKPSWRKPTYSAWPKGESPDWHIKELRLEEAFEIRASKLITQPALVAILDNQFADSHSPMLDDFFVHGQTPAKRNLYRVFVPNAGGIIGGPDHGTATLSLLAGNRINVDDGRGTAISGANPYADILAVSGFGGVAQLSNVDGEVRMIRAALEFNENPNFPGARIPDAVSMSHGGLYSAALQEVCSALYMKGIPLFAAAGNHLAIPFFFWQTPTYTAYPAAFDSVIAVTGVTAAQKAYRIGPNLWGFFKPHSGWFQRGNAGPDRIMDRAVAGYSPNVPWALYNSRQIDRDGSGTSAATPQVAGVASLWIEYYRDEINAELKRSGIPAWGRTEMVYQAILRCATPRETFKCEDVGIGTVNAARILAISPSSLTIGKEPQLSNRGPSIIELLLSGFIHRVPDVVTLDGSLEVSPAERLAIESIRTAFGLNVDQRLRTSESARVDEWTLLNALSTEAAQILQLNKKSPGTLSTLLRLSEDEARAAPDAQKNELVLAAEYILGSRHASDPLRQVIRAAKSKSRAP